MINILNTYTSFPEGFAWNIFGFFIGLTLLVITIAVFKDRDIPKGVAVIFSIFTALFLLISTLNIILTQRITYYEVSITDDMNFKDFNSKYEIVSQRGEIYTIILKEEQ